MDVISLYLSIDIDSAVKKHIEVISESEVEFREVNMRELDHFPTLNYNNDYLDDHDFSRFCPTRSATIASAVKKSTSEC